MPWCPICKSEYREGFNVCSDCGSKLVDELEDEKVKSDNNDINDDFTYKTLKFISLIIGIALIFFSPIISYKLTSAFLTSGGIEKADAQYFKWMLSAYHYSALICGIIICLPSIIFFSRKKK